MKHTLHPKHHKQTLVWYLAFISFAGFESLALTLRYYQLQVFWELAAYLYAFVLLWTGFAYNTHYRHHARKIRQKTPHSHEFLNYLILPTVIYWAAVVLLFLDPFARLSQFVWILFGSFGLTACLWYLKTVFRSHSTAGKGLPRQLIFLVKILASFLAITASLGIGHYMGYGGAWTAFLVFLVSMLLMRQALFQHHRINSHTVTLTLAASTILALSAYFIFDLWSVNYYTAGLALAALYNTIWGFVYHEYIARDLTRKIVYEYLAVLFVVAVILFSTANFAERI